MPRARIAPAARDDLRDIRLYSKSAFGSVTARAYMLGLRDVLALAATKPLMRIAESDLGADMRSFAYRSHRIYYRLDQAGILVVRILHHARDIPRAMDDVRD